MERRSSKASEFRATDVEGSPQIEAYFAVFNDIYEMYPGGTESIDPHAFDDALSDDIRCLITIPHWYLVAPRSERLRFRLTITA